MFYQDFFNVSDAKLQIWKRWFNLPCQLQHFLLHCLGDSLKERDHINTLIFSLICWFIWLWYLLQINQEFLWFLLLHRDVFFKGLLQAWSCFHHLMVLLLFHTGCRATYQCHWPYWRSVCVSTNFIFYI